MIDFMDAVTTARASFEKIYTRPFEELNVEEVELTDDNKSWMVTLGFVDPRTNVEPTTAASTLLGLKNRPLRRYKVVHIDAERGTFRSLKDLPV